MKKLTIIYWSGTGNTEQMANLIENGAKEKGAEVKMVNVCDATDEDVKDAEVLAIGSPSMGAEVIEEYEMEPFVSSIERIINGKKLGLFGSYGWGTGEWMENWVERMEACGANVLDKGLIANGLPEGEEEEACIEYGRKLVE